MKFNGDILNVIFPREMFVNINSQELIEAYSNIFAPQSWYIEYFGQLAYYEIWRRLTLFS